MSDRRSAVHKVRTHCLLARMAMAEMSASFGSTAAAFRRLNQAIADMTASAMDEAATEAQMAGFKPYP